MSANTASASAELWSLYDDGPLLHVRWMEHWKMTMVLWHIALFAKTYEERSRLHGQLVAAFRLAQHRGEPFDADDWWQRH